MGTTNTIGDTAEIAIAQDCIKRGYKVAFPFGHDWSCDLIVERNGRLERIQVKHGKLNEDESSISCKLGRSHYNTHNHGYNDGEFDWLAVYCSETSRCYYMDFEKLSKQQKGITLRLYETKNGQLKNVRWAYSYENF